MSGVLARIIARYLAGGLVAYGLLDAAEAEGLTPELALAIGAALAALTEAAYAVARRLGWAT